MSAADKRKTVVFLDAGTLPGGVDLSTGPDVDYRAYQFTLPHETVARIADADVVITNKVCLGEAEVAAAPRLKLICVAAAGTDNVDQVATAARGIQVRNVPDYGSLSVAEHAIASLLHLRRHLSAYAQAASDGRWAAAKQFCWHGPTIRNVGGSVIGILGRGRIGLATARLAEGLGMTVLFGAAPGREPDQGQIALDQLLPRVDALSLHLPLTAQTRGLINAERLASMKRDAILINTGRGALVDPVALAAALKAGQIGGAAIDVLETEPPPANHPLLQPGIPNLLLTPHVAWASQEAQHRLASEVVRSVMTFLQ